MGYKTRFSAIRQKFSLKRNASPKRRMYSRVKSAWSKAKQRFSLKRNASPKRRMYSRVKSAWSKARQRFSPKRAPAAAPVQWQSEVFQPQRLRPRAASSFP